MVVFRFYNFVDSFQCQKDNRVPEKEHKPHDSNNNNYCCCAGSNAVCIASSSSCGGCVEEAQEATWKRYIRLAIFSANMYPTKAKLLLTG